MLETTPIHDPEPSGLTAEKARGFVLEGEARTIPPKISSFVPRLRKNKQGDYLEAGYTFDLMDV